LMLRICGFIESIPASRRVRSSWRRCVSESSVTNNRLLRLVWVVLVTSISFAGANELRAQTSSEESARELVRKAIESRANAPFVSIYRQEKIEAQFRSVAAEPERA